MNDRRFDLNDYVSVQDRIHQFWRDHPDGRIVTTLASPADNFERCRYRAEVYKDGAATIARPDATGYAFELAGTGMANKTSHEENCETSAIGRALANLGYATSQKDRPSREEMAKVERNSQPRPLRPESIAQERQRLAAVADASVPPPKPEGPPHPLAEYIEQDAKDRKVWMLGDTYFNAAHTAKGWVFQTVDLCAEHGGTPWRAIYDEGMGKSIPIFTHQTSNPQQPCVLGAEDDL
jgi:hypothetical protein